MSEQKSDDDSQCPKAGRNIDLDDNPKGSHGVCILRVLARRDPEVAVVALGEQISRRSRDYRLTVDVREPPTVNPRRIRSESAAHAEQLGQIGRGLEA